MFCHHVCSVFFLCITTALMFVLFFVLRQKRKYKEKLNKFSKFCSTHISYTYYTRYSIYIYVYILFDSLVLLFSIFHYKLLSFSHFSFFIKNVCLRLLSLVGISLLLFIHCLLDPQFVVARELVKSISNI